MDGWVDLIGTVGSAMDRRVDDILVIAEWCNRPVGVEMYIV